MNNGTTTMQNQGQYYTPQLNNNSANRPKLSIIIVSFNTRDVTDECLRSIYTAEWRDDFEIIVIDNASKDGSCEMINNKYPQVRLIENSENVLFAKANNQGAAIAKGDYVLLLNSDTIVEKNNLQKND